MKKIRENQEVYVFNDYTVEVNSIDGEVPEAFSRHAKMVSKNSVALSCFSPAITKGIKKDLIDNGYEIDD